VVELKHHSNKADLDPPKLGPRVTVVVDHVEADPVGRLLQPLEPHEIASRGLVEPPPRERQEHQRRFGKKVVEGGGGGARSHGQVQEAAPEVRHVRRKNGEGFGLGAG
jgi:hypothetical protein